MFKDNDLTGIINRLIDIEQNGVSVKIQPKTTNGLPINVNYKPTLGFIFYTRSENMVLESFIEHISKELGKTTLINQYKIVSHSLNTTSNVLIQDNYIERTIEEKDDISSIKHFVNSAFTWIVTPLQNALNIENTKNLTNVNLILSSVIYDSNNLLYNIENKTLVYNLSYEDYLQLPSFLCSDNNSYRNILSIYDGGLIIDSKQGTAHYMSNLNCVIETKKEIKKEEEWNHTDIMVGRDHKLNRYEYADAKYLKYSCTNCDTPLYGRVVCLSNIKTSDKKKNLKKNLTKLLDINSKILVCVYCWDTLNSTSKGGIYLSSDVTFAILPFKQTETALACGFNLLIPILESKIKPVEEGVFLASYNGYEFLITSEKLGLYPEFTNPIIKKLNLCVITNVPIVEFCESY